MLCSWVSLGYVRGNNNNITISKIKTITKNMTNKNSSRTRISKVKQNKSSKINQREDPSPSRSLTQSGKSDPIAVNGSSVSQA